MTEQHGGYKHPGEKGKGMPKQAYHQESASAPDLDESGWDPDEESEASPYGPINVQIQPKIAFTPYEAGMSKTIKKSKKVKKSYHPAYVASHPKPHPMHKCPPIMCDPQYIVRDCYIPREVPVVHPIVNVNRHVIVNVPRHYYQPMTKNEVVDPGCPGTGSHHPGKHGPGYGH